MVKGQKFGSRGIDGDGHMAGIVGEKRTHLSVPGCLRGHVRNRGYARRLPVSFVVRKKECAVLQDRTADRSPELVTLEGWNAPQIEIVSGVERAIPQEFVRASVNLICP